MTIVRSAGRFVMNGNGDQHTANITEYRVIIYTLQK